MNERLTIQDLTDLLAAKHSMTKKDAEAFVKEFFLLIEQALENEKTVKIKGLGTFKLIDVDSRESVNVNTGERFQIKGHTKVSFSPDTNLRDTINKPFAHFETVVLNENTILEDTPIEDTEEEEAEEETSAQTVLNEVGEGTAPLVTEEYESTDDELSEKELIQEEQITAQPSVKDSIEESVIIENVSTVEESIEPSSHVGLKETSTETDIEEKVEQLKDEEVPEEEVAIVEQEPTVPIIPSAKKETIKPVKLEQVSQPTSKKTASVKEKSPVPYLIAVIVIVLLLCGGVILFIYYPDLFSSSSDNNALDMPPVTTQPVQQETQLSDTIEQKDTIKEITPDAPKVVTPTSPVAQKEGTVPAKAEPQPAPRQPATSVYLDSASYKITGTKTKYTIKEGETLTKVSLRFYGTKAMWPYIVKHNPKAIKNPNNVPYGTIIEIPELTKE
ncbi:HU family DNA-binding protein [Bacteroides caecimuris]|uniref:HU family DNA-binding protein n=1 Tax=Bacteroides caecimuris TaxID=1796613 RepID=A0A4S2CV08_9BACE|nr:HU family DNA-binding protein [Bacteroides caecimuris]TGY31823.1 HU family DNA-binding protein [Bacteroides caecimuris]